MRQPPTPDPALLIAYERSLSDQRHAWRRYIDAATATRQAWDAYRRTLYGDDLPTTPGALS